LVKDEKHFSYPLMGWLKTEDEVWHRFFIDAHMLHWVEYSEEEMKEVREEDFEDEEFDGAYWIVRDLMLEFNLENNKIKDAQMVYFRKGSLMCGQLQIKVDGDTEILLNDYGDEADPELFVKSRK
jgi:hypothetical protein